MIEIRLPLKAESTANLREHWAVRAKRTRAQRAAVARRLPIWDGGPLLVVRLTRISPRMLDSGDNLSMSLKGFRDSVASRLRVDDATPLVSWEYHQTKGEAEVVVQIWRAGEKAPPSPEGMPVERKRKTAGPKGSAFDHVVNKTLRAPRPAYEPPRKPGGMGMHLYEQEHPGPIKRAAMSHAKNDAPVPRGSNTNPMSTSAVVMSAENSAIHRAVLAAQEAEATFAPAPVPPCDNCGEPYRPKCFDPKAPPGSVKCRKDVQCYRYDGHNGDCLSGNPRSCTT